MSSVNDHARLVIGRFADSKPSSLRVDLGKKIFGGSYSANAIAGPSRLPASAPAGRAKSAALPFNEGDASDEERSRGGSFDVNGAVLDAMLLREAAAFIPGGKPCRWFHCDIRLASHDIWLKHVILHADKEPRRAIATEDEFEAPLRCRVGGCRDQFYERDELKTHIHRHAMFGPHSHPKAWRMPKNHSVMRNALAARSPFDPLPRSACPRFVDAAPPPSPPPLPRLFANIPNYLIPGIVTAARQVTVSADMKAKIAPRPFRFFHPSVDAQSWNRGASSSLYRMMAPYHVHQVPEDDQEASQADAESDSDSDEPFDPVHRHMAEVCELDEMPNLAAAPTLRPTTGAIQITQRRWKGRSAINISADIIMLHSSKKRKRSIELTAEEALDRRAAKNVGASFGFAFQHERLRLQGKMDEESPGV